MSDQNIPKVKTSGAHAPVSKTAGFSSGGQEKDSSPNTDEEITQTEDQETEDDDQDEGEEEEKPERPSPYFDTVDVMFYVSVALISELGVTSFICAPTIWLFLFFKGVHPVAMKRNVFAQGIKNIPLIGWLIPISVASAILTIISTNHPETLDKLGGVGKLFKAVEKVGGGK